ncbi:unnamed protein product [Staurois parvus]|uniref:Uncharacterized protein n=1 Tax=Staurois parvus TaxID=386267 RepID=A0ABN9CHN0_9NEOB|nr:unnamed protein product [Staurois parvus]
MCPRRHRIIHKAQHRFLRMRTWHPAVMPSAHTTEAGKTARRWIEEQVRSKNKEVRAGTCQIQVPAPHLFKGQQSSP